MDDVLRQAEAPAAFSGEVENRMVESGLRWGERRHRALHPASPGARPSGASASSTGRRARSTVSSRRSRASPSSSSNCGRSNWRSSTSDPTRGHVTSRTARPSAAPKVSSASTDDGPRLGTKLCAARRRTRRARRKRASRARPSSPRPGPLEGPEPTPRARRTRSRARASRPTACAVSIVAGGAGQHLEHRPRTTPYARHERVARRDRDDDGPERDRPSARSRHAS